MTFGEEILPAADLAQRALSLVRNSRDGIARQVGGAGSIRAAVRNLRPGDDGGPYREAMVRAREGIERASYICRLHQAQAPGADTRLVAAAILKALPSDTRRFPDTVRELDTLVAAVEAATRA